jgi:hypothetical protein
MSEISITGAAFAGLNGLRRRPVTLLVWYVLMVLLAGGAMVILASAAGSAMADLQEIQASGGQADPQMALSATGRMLGGVLLTVPIYLILGAMGTAAANRLVLRPQDSAMGYVRLGGDELRLIVVTLVIGLICLGIYMVGAVIAGVVAAVTTGAIGGAPDPTKMMPAYLASFAPFALLLIFILLKFSLAPAQTIDTKAISIFGSWGLTKGHFGKVFLTYLLAAVVYCVIYAVGLGIAVGVWGAMGVEGGLAGIMRPDLTSVGAVLTGPRLVYFLIMGLVSALGLALIASPGAALYQQITGRTTEEAFE